MSGFLSAGIVDGGEIPDSAIAQYDGTQISATDGESVASWIDEIGTFDLGDGVAPTYQTSVINGNAVVRFDGADDYLFETSLSVNQPFTVGTVFQYNSVSEFRTIWSQNDSTPLNFFGSSSGAASHRLFNDGSGITGGTPDTDPHIAMAIVDGGSSEIRIDGTSVASGTIGTDSLDGLRLGIRGGDGGFHFDGDIGEHVIYDADLGATSDLTEEEQRLSEKWGIAI